GGVPDLPGHDHSEQRAEDQRRAGGGRGEPRLGGDEGGIGQEQHAQAEEGADDPGVRAAGAVGAGAAQRPPGGRRGGGAFRDRDQPGDPAGLPDDVPGGRQGAERHVQRDTAEESDGRGAAFGTDDGQDQRDHADGRGGQTRRGRRGGERLEREAGGDQGRDRRRHGAAAEGDGERPGEDGGREDRERDQGLTGWAAGRGIDEGAARPQQLQHDHRQHGDER